MLFTSTQGVCSPSTNHWDWSYIPLFHWSCFFPEPSCRLGPLIHSGAASFWFCYFLLFLLTGGNITVPHCPTSCSHCELNVTVPSCEDLLFQAMYVCNIFIIVLLISSEGCLLALLNSWLCFWIPLLIDLRPQICRCLLCGWIHWIQKNLSMLWFLWSCI